MKKKIEAPKFNETQCVTIIGGLVASLTLLADIQDVRKAVQWWSRNGKAWGHLAALQQTHRETIALATRAKAASK